jgi:hypothetical protein
MRRRGDRKGNATMNQPAPLLLTAVILCAALCSIARAEDPSEISPFLRKSVNWKCGNTSPVCNGSGKKIS